MIGSLHLAELLCSRLCHDLSGLLGSLVGVLEIAREEQAESETLAVAEETAVEMTQRLKLLRAAWGQDCEPVDVSQLLAFADGLFASRRVRLDLFGMEPEAAFTPGVGRLLLNILLLAAESLPGGGIVALSGSPDRCGGDDRRPTGGLATWARRVSDRRDSGLGHRDHRASPAGALDRTDRPRTRYSAVDVDARRGRQRRCPAAIAAIFRESSAAEPGPLIADHLPSVYCLFASVGPGWRPARDFPGSRGLPWTICLPIF